VLQGDFREGDVVHVDVDKGALVLRREVPINA
jgi:hypothetical protein